MMNVVIYEDSFTYRMFLVNAVMEYIQNHFDDIVLELYTDDRGEVERYIERNQIFTLYFIDIIDKGGKKSGLELAERIKSNNSSDQVVFITQYLRIILTQPLHKINSLNIISKKLKNAMLEVHETIEYAYSRLPNDDCLVINSEYGDFFKVAYDDIYMIETVKGSHRVRIRYKNDGEYEFKALLKDIYEKLDERFTYCHRCYVVNIDKVERIRAKSREIVFDNGLTCPYSKKRYKKMQSEVLKSEY